MSSISAGTTSGTALVTSGDTTGQLVFKTNGSTTALTLNTDQTATFVGAISAPSISISGGALPVSSGGTGATSLAANNVLLGNGTSAVQVVAPGTAGNVLTSNGTTWQSTAPAPAFTATATGSISADAPVIVNSNGTVSQGSGTFSSQSFTTASGPSLTMVQDNNTPYACFAGTTGTVIVTYRRSSDNYWVAVAGTVSSTGLSWGTAVVLGSNYYDNQAIVWDSANSCAFAMARLAGVGGYYSVLTLSGNTITASAAAAVPYQTNGESYITYSASAQRVFVASYDSSVNPPGTWIYAMRKTGATTYSGDGYVDLGSGYGVAGITAGNNSNGVLIGYNNSNNVAALGFTYSGSTTTTGSWTSTGVTSSVSIDVLSIAYNSSDNNYLMIFRFWTGSSGGVRGIAMTLSGTTLTIGSAVLVSNSISGSYPAYQYVSYNPIANYYVVFYENFNNSNYGATSLVSVSGTTVSLIDTTQNATSDRPGYAYTVFDFSNAKTALIYSAGGSAGQITIREITLNYTGAPTSSNFVGFSSASYSNGQTATVKINGNTSTQTGLTPATKYYLTPGGLLTTLTTDVYAGIAASSTTLLIKA